MAVRRQIRRAWLFFIITIPEGLVTCVRWRRATMRSPGLGEEDPPHQPCREMRR